MGRWIALQRATLKQWRAARMIRRAIALRNKGGRLSAEADAIFARYERRSVPRG